MTALYWISKRMRFSLDFSFLFSYKCCPKFQSCLFFCRFEQIIFHSMLEIVSFRFIDQRNCLCNKMEIISWRENNQSNGKKCYCWHQKISNFDCISNWRFSFGTLGHSKCHKMYKLNFLNQSTDILVNKSCFQEPPDGFVSTSWLKNLCELLIRVKWLTLMRAICSSCK